jgi:hypothetical protein
MVLHTATSLGVSSSSPPSSSFCSASSSSSQAELRVREIASRIGLGDDSEILRAVCHKMREEYVVELWQLPGLDSRQWERLHAPVGLAVAVQRLSSSTAASMSRSESLATLLRLTHEREQHQLHDGRRRASSIFRFHSCRSGSTDPAGGQDAEYGDDKEATDEEDEEMVAKLVAAPLDLPPHYLEGRNTSSSSGGGTGEEKQEEDEEFIIESRMEGNHFEGVNLKSPTSVVRDAFETDVVMAEEHVKEPGELEGDDQRGAVLRGPGERRQFKVEVSESFDSFCDEALELCLADHSEQLGMFSSTEDLEGSPSVLLSPATTVATLTSTPEKPPRSPVEEWHEGKAEATVMTFPVSTVTTLMSTPEKTSRSQVEQWQEEKADATFMASPTTTATTLMPTPEKPSRSGGSDPSILEDHVDTGPHASSPTVMLNDESFYSSPDNSAMRISITSSSEDEREEAYLDVPSIVVPGRPSSNARSSSVNELLLLPRAFKENSDDDATVVISNVTAEGQAVALRRTRSELYDRKALDGKMRLQLLY